MSNLSTILASDNLLSKHELEGVFRRWKYEKNKIEDWEGGNEASAYWFVKMCHVRNFIKEGRQEERFWYFQDCYLIWEGVFGRQK